MVSGLAGESPRLTHYLYESPSRCRSRTLSAVSRDFPSLTQRVPRGPGPRGPPTPKVVEVTVISPSVLPEHRPPGVTSCDPRPLGRFSEEDRGVPSPKFKANHLRLGNKNLENGPVVPSWDWALLGTVDFDPPSTSSRVDPQGSTGSVCEPGWDEVDGDQVKVEAMGMGGFRTSGHRSQESGTCPRLSETEGPHPRSVQSPVYSLFKEDVRVPRHWTSDRPVSTSGGARDPRHVCLPGVDSSGDPDRGPRVTSVLGPEVGRVCVPGRHS